MDNTKNREQRRKEARLKRKERKTMRPCVPIERPPGSTLKSGDKFTIGGYKLNKDGTTIFDCKYGEETVFILTDIEYSSGKIGHKQ